MVVGNTDALRERAALHREGTRASLRQMRRQLRKAETASGCDDVLVAMFNAWRLRGVADAHLHAIVPGRAGRRSFERDVETVYELTARWHTLYDSLVFQCTRR